jgi:hypothetical protein
MGTDKKFTELGQAEIENIAKKNPAVRLEEVAKALKMIQELHRMGLTGSGYNVRSPYSRSPLHSRGDDESERTPNEADC